MGMSIDEAINHIKYGIIENNYPLQRDLGIEACNLAIDIMCKYQKIEQILDIEPVLTLPNNPTNGDMIKALFPDVKILDDGFTIEWRKNGKFITTFDSNDWWNAPYKETTNDSED